MRKDYSEKENLLALIEATAPVKKTAQKSLKNSKLFDNIGSD